LKLAGFLAAHARLTPDREAVRCGKEHLSFAQLDQRSTQLANALATRGVGTGDRVVIFLHNRVEFPVAFMGIVKAGAIAVTPNPRLSATEVSYILGDAAPKAVIFDNETRETLARADTGAALRICVDAACEPGEYAFTSLAEESGTLLPRVPPEFDDCMISYTSGTTGKPKGAIITQANYITSNGFLNAQQWGMSAADRILTTTPLAHRSAFSRLMNTICLGSSIVFMRNFDAGDAARIIEKEQITVLNMVPTVARMLLPEIEAAPERFRSLRMSTVSAEAFPVELKQRLLKVLPHLQLVSFFAMTEMGPITNLGTDGQITKAASVGRVNPGMEVKLVDSSGAEVPPGEAGEIIVRTGPAGRYVTMRGYFNNPQATADAIQDGWLRTGDMGRFDAEGYLYIVDRKKDMVLSGGYNIYSKEVEAAILEISGVHDVAVVGVPDPVFGEAVAAFVEPEPGAPLTAEHIIEHCRERIASYKKPKHVRFMNGLPRNSTGKVLKYQLREKFGEE
jgi:long-chain acyl-CoA synthetase